MTDPTPSQQQGAQAQVTLNSQYIKDLSFESPNAPQIFSPSSSAPTLNVGVNVQTRSLPDNAHEVALLMKLEATVDNKKAFIVELAYAGVFTLPPLPDDRTRLFLFVEGPHLLFPFARAIVANAVRDGGFPPLLLNPIDFAALYQASQAQMNQPPAGTA